MRINLTCLVLLLTHLSIHAQPYPLGYFRDKWDSDANKWEEVGKATYTRNSNNQILEQTYLRYEGKSGINSYKIVNEYDEHHLNSRNSWFNLIDGDWVEESRRITTRDSEKRILVSADYHIHNMSGTFLPNYIRTTVYDDEGRKISYETEGYSYELIYTKTKDEYSYDENLVTKLSYVWDNESETWLDAHQKVESELNDDDKNIWEVTYSWEEDWQRSRRIEFSYENNNLTTTSVEFDPIDLDSWEETTRRREEITVNDEINQGIFYVWDYDSEEWLITKQFTNQYNTEGQRTSYESYFTYAPHDTELIGENKTDISYENGKQVEHIIYFWGESDWQPFDKAEHKYSGDSLKSLTSSHWNINDGWVKNTRFNYYFTEPTSNEQLTEEQETGDPVESDLITTVKMPFEKSIYPTLVKDKLQIQSAPEISSMLIIDNKGRIAKGGKIDVNSENSEIDVSDLNSGMYFIKLISGTEQFTYRFIKQ